MILPRAGWVLSAFLLANAAVTWALLPLLRVRDPTYRTFPWIFLAAGLLAAVPPLARRLLAGSLAWRALPVVAYAGVISLASSVSGASPSGVSGNVFHPVEYAGLAFLTQLVAHAGLAVRPTARRVGLVMLGCVAFGALDELHQHFVPTRACTLEDLGLDALGTAIGTLAFLAFARLLPGARPEPEADDAHA